MSELLDLAATDLAARVRRREVSPLELVDAHIARLELVNPPLNALVDERFDRARDEARAATERLAHAHADDLPPLFGVPVSIKEFLAVEGMSHTSGLVARRGRRATQDATTVARLRAAGVIVLGVTNGPEGGLYLETHNPLFGRTHNPWDLARTCGGSSGGEGAIVASGGSALGLGSDIGGSIRLPASFCGTVGHKPTGRMVPNTGQTPPLAGELSAYNVVGPLCRRVADVMPVLRAIAGPDGVDPVTLPFELGEPGSVRLRDLVVYPVEWNGRAPASEAMRRAVRLAADALRDRGARIGHLSPGKLRRGFEIWSAMMSEAGETYVEVLADHGEPISLWRELLRFPLGRSRHTGPPLLIASLEQLLRVLRFPTEGLVRAGRALQAELEAELGDRGVLLHPPYTSTAPLHHAPLLRPFDASHTGIFNVLELPATVLPVGFDGGGLPVGVQVIARRGLDHLTIAVARALEEDFGGWVRAEPQRLPPPSSLLARVVRRLDAAPLEPPGLGRAAR